MSFPHRYCEPTIPIWDVRTKEDVGPSVGFMGCCCAFPVQGNGCSTKERVLYVMLRMCLQAALLTRVD